LFAFIIVTVLFSGFYGFFDLRLPVFRNSPAQGAEMIRFADAEMARSWLLEAEENGPFPGRLQVDDGDGAAMILEGAGLEAWTDYQFTLRVLPEEETLDRVEITPKGKRVFPAFRDAASASDPDVSRQAVMRRIPILIPYDRFALEWIPEKTPDFALPAGAEIAPDSMRFAVSLREDGGVAELIPMAGGADPAQEAIERWLRGVRFREGTGERWFGLRVDFVNRRADVTQPE